MGPGDHCPAHLPIHVAELLDSALQDVIFPLLGYEGLWLVLRQADSARTDTKPRRGNLKVLAEEIIPEELPPDEWLPLVHPGAAHFVGVSFDIGRPGPAAIPVPGFDEDSLGASGGEVAGCGEAGVASTDDGYIINCGLGINFGRWLDNSKR